MIFNIFFSSSHEIYVYFLIILLNQSVFLYTKPRECDFTIRNVNEIQISRNEDFGKRAVYSR